MEESPLFPEPDPYDQERQEIGQIASHLVDDNDVIMITQGPTALQLVRNLGDKKKPDGPDKRSSYCTGTDDTFGYQDYSPGRRPGTSIPRGIRQLYY